MRVQNWPSLLYLHLQDPPPFVWGQTDCVLWCCDWIFQAIGEDLSQDLRGKYSTALEAQEIIEAMGYSDASDLADANLDEISISFAQRGDILLHPSGCLGICDGHYGHFLTTEGIAKLPVQRCCKAWRV